MKIAVLFLTRARPAGLIAAVQAMHATASGAHDVAYVICGDDDDAALPPAVDLLQTSLGSAVVPSIQPRPDALGWHWNRGAEEAGDWDIAFLTGDDTIPLTMHWDQRMAQLAAYGAPAFAWQEVNDPTNVTYPAVTRRWFDALGRIVPECFPYWFNDTWLAEVHMFAFGRTLPIEGTLQMGGRRGTTREMRELAFWFGHFAATRAERLAEARLVAKAYGTPMPDPADALAWCAEWDRIQAASIPRYNAIFAADQAPWTARYIRLRNAAQPALDCQMAV